jgi:chloride channel protein, CIC family
LFLYLIHAVNYLFFIETPKFLPFGNYIFILIPAIGGLIVGFLVYFLALETKGHGIPEIMEAIATKKGIIRSRIIAVKSIASALTIGSGGSAGRAGPVVQIGGAIGSFFSQTLNITPYQTKILVACGVAAGISATFNTPIAAVVFTLELIIREFKTRSFIPIVISSVVGTVISREFLFILGVKEKFVFTVPTYTLVNSWELVFYLILGLIAGVVAIIFTKSLYSFEDLFEKIKIPTHIKPAFGGLLVGCIGFILLTYTGSFYIFGIGQNEISLLFSGGITVLGIIFVLIFLKIIATSLTLGSGGSGGIFFPALFIGSMTGAAFGLSLNSFLPNITAGYEAYALVGMAAVFAGCSRATLTSILIVFEMTGVYDIILPLMFACVISNAVGFYGLKKESIYTIKLRRKGIIIDHDMGVNSMKTQTVKEVMNKNVKSINKDIKIAKLHNMIKKEGFLIYPVVDEEEKLIGIVTRIDVKDALLSDKKTKTAKEIMSTDIISVTPDYTLDQVIEKMIKSGLTRLPVVDPKNEKRLLGIITKDDILHYYKKAK